jgi:hypothetical protein
MTRVLVGASQAVRNASEVNDIQVPSRPHPFREGLQHSNAKTAGHRSAGHRLTRMIALGALGIVLGSGGAILAVSGVQAFDEAGVRDFFVQEQRRKEGGARAKPIQPQQPVYYAPASYAPMRSITLPFLQNVDNGRLAGPAVNLNPFKRNAPKASAKAEARSGGRTMTDEVAVDTVSGASNTARTICVRVCDGFHSPLGYLASQSDIGGHEALCKAMNPGVPVKVYKVAAGATTINDATGPDGKTYAAMPMAYSHEKAADPSCRPKIVQAGERRISVLRDFTLRPGDTVVLDGTARVFNGANRYPFQSADFQDFRNSGRLSDQERRNIDAKIGLTFTAAAERTARKASRLKEASLGNKGSKSDIDMPLVLRGAVPLTVDTALYTESSRGLVRVIAPGMFNTTR